MKRTIEDVLENLDFVGCDNDTARELCAEIKRPREIDLDWNRLRSGDKRALNPDHQDVFNMVFDLQAENELLRALLQSRGWQEGTPEWINWEQRVCDALGETVRQSNDSHT